MFLLFLLVLCSSDWVDSFCFRTWHTCIPRSLMLGSRSMASNRRKVGFVNKNIHSCLSKLRGKFREIERSSIRSSNVHIYRIFDKTFVRFKLLCSSERCVSSKKRRWTCASIVLNTITKKKFRFFISKFKNAHFLGSPNFFYNFFLVFVFETIDRQMFS